MSHMFFNAPAFNKPIDFDTASVVDLTAMFSGATTFNQRLSKRFVMTRITDDSDDYSYSYTMEIPGSNECATGL